MLGRWIKERVQRSKTRYAAALAASTASEEERKTVYVSTRWAPGLDSPPRLLPIVSEVEEETVTS
jgi:hypothetical protein